MPPRSRALTRLKTDNRRSLFFSFPAWVCWDCRDDTSVCYAAVFMTHAAVFIQVKSRGLCCLDRSSRMCSVYPACLLHTQPSDMKQKWHVEMHEPGSNFTSRAYTSHIPPFRIRPVAVEEGKCILQLRRFHQILHLDSLIGCVHFAGSVFAADFSIQLSLFWWRAESLLSRYTLTQTRTQTQTHSKETLSGLFTRV